MLDAITQVPAPYNEPVHSFAPGSGERTALEAMLKELAAERAELTMTIGGEQRLGGGQTIDVLPWTCRGGRPLWHRGYRSVVGNETPPVRGVA